MNRLGGAIDGLRERLAASEIGQQLWARYQGASAAQQLAARVAAVALALALLVFGLVWPLHDYSQASQTRYRQQLDTLAWMQQNRDRVQAGGETSRVAGDSLLATVTQAASGAGLSIRRYEPAGDNGLNLWLENVSFDATIHWLEQLERDSQIRATDFSARRRSSAGRVDVRVTLEG